MTARRGEQDAWPRTWFVAALALTLAVLLGGGAPLLGADPAPRVGFDAEAVRHELALLPADPAPRVGFDAEAVRRELALLTRPPDRAVVPDDEAWVAAAARVVDAEWLAAIDVVPQRALAVPPQSPDSAELFAEEFPSQAAARQREGDPATFHWAVLVGVNTYQGAGNTFGSVPDAQILHDELRARGWRDDHILVLTDRQATGERIVRALEWLARTTDERSTVVFSMSGHIRHRAGVSALWPTDSRYIWAGELGALLEPIRADKMWLSFQGCHAAGLAAPGVEGDNRVVTYSSHAHEKSFEDPETRQSLQGFYMFTEGIRDGWGDRRGAADGRTSVQEAFAWGAPRAAIRSSGRQQPVMVDGLDRPFHLEIEPVAETVPASVRER